MIALVVPVSTEALTSERVVKEIEIDRPLTSVQLALVVTSSLQSSGTGGRDARALADLALHDLVANFSPELSGQVDLEAPAFLTFLTILGD